MVLGLAGHRIAHGATAKRRWGKRFCRTGTKCREGKMVGPRPSLRRKAQGHHAWPSVSQDTPQPLRFAERALDAKFFFPTPCEARHCADGRGMKRGDEGMADAQKQECHRGAAKA